MQSVKGLKNVLKGLQKFGVESEKRVHEIAGDNATKIAVEAQMNAPSNIGKLRQSIRTQEEKRADFKIIVGSPYGAFLEFGTGKKVSVPAEMKAIAIQFKGKKTGTFDEFIRSLLDWIKQKGITGSYSVKTKRRSKAKNSFGESNSGEDERIAFAIAMSILRNGIKPQPYLYPAFVKGREKYFKDLKKEYKY